MQVKPFRISVPSADIHDLRRRLSDTRWGPVIPGAGWSMGMDQDYLRSFVEYWRRDFDWHAVEVELNRAPQFMVETNMGSVHFAHFRSTDASAVPIVLTHGWPSTFAELLALGRNLSGPAKPGAQSFHVVIPSLPGYIFSPPPMHLGTNSFVIAEQWVSLMNSLGYSRFVAHGGDIGAGVSTVLGLRFPERVMGVHLNYIPGSYQPFLSDAVGLTDEERKSLAIRDAWGDQEGAYGRVQATKPDVLGPGLNDSPVGLAAWILDKYRSWSDCDGNLERRFKRQDLATIVSLYWFTGSMPSAIRIYWEGRRRPLKFAEGERVTVPVAIAHFPKELPIPARTYVERGYNVVRWTEYPKGGHFAAAEESVELASDIRQFTKMLLT